MQVSATPFLMPRRKATPYVPKPRPTAADLRDRANLSIEEARILTGYSRSKVKELIDSGEWGSFIEGKRHRIITASISEYQNRKSRGTETATGRVDFDEIIHGLSLARSFLSSARDTVKKQWRDSGGRLHEDPTHTALQLITDALECQQTALERIADHVLTS